MDREQLDDWCEKAVLGLVLAILVYSPLAIGAVRPQEFVWIQWMVVAILVAWAVRFAANPKHRLLWPPVCWPVLLFILYAIGRYLTAEVEYLARQELIRVLVYGVIFFAVINNLHKQETTQIVGLALIFLAMAISLYALFQFLTASDYTWHFLKPTGYRKRESGTFICPNNLRAIWLHHAAGAGLHADGPHRSLVEGLSPMRRWPSSPHHRDAFAGRMAGHGVSLAPFYILAVDPPRLPEAGPDGPGRVGPDFSRDLFQGGFAAASLRAVDRRGAGGGRAFPAVGPDGGHVEGSFLVRRRAGAF
jgi:hypothetical protein